MFTHFPKMENYQKIGYPKNVQNRKLEFEKKKERTIAKTCYLPYCLFLS